MNFWFLWSILGLALGGAAAMILSPNYLRKTVGLLVPVLVPVE